ncbi:Isoquinoline 1-oxidoreductase subunit [Rhodopseudomonas sp. BR0M22]|uniref:Isoquinoline 1-oxidoreductase subunit n=1 Tax=Rhodopseudomonas sp. BR0M22 TaxID=2269369 RepID=UPI0013E0BFBE|nr:Isoquinoline 1-oxidoreductase subunit [Rhodopseudomonas sp. BR0M22]NEW92026.1 Isoquinoline 1-oxidoreductase subunit [Rhodopseudomonas sp. BR0M22]
MSRVRQAVLAGFAGVLVASLVAVAGPLLPGEADAASRAADSTQLRPVSDFAKIRDKQKRAIALFEEAGKVITSPRCMNCHPAGDRPTQTDAMRPHQPLVVRGEHGLGPPSGLACTTCHHQANFDPAGVPGNPKWALAPLEMAWQGKTLGQICVQIKDRTRNGDKDMAALVHHMAEDELVGWGWHPGEGRTPAPGTQKQFGALIKAWAEAGAACPKG